MFKGPTAASGPTHPKAQGSKFSFLNGTAPLGEKAAPRVNQYLWPLLRNDLTLLFSNLAGINTLGRNGIGRDLYPEEELQTDVCVCVCKDTDEGPCLRRMCVVPQCCLHDCSLTHIS